MAVARMETCEDVGELARELGVRPRCLYKWRRKLEMVEPGQEASRPSTHASTRFTRNPILGRLGTRLVLCAEKQKLGSSSVSCQNAILLLR